MVNANFIIIRKLMIWPSVMLGLFFLSIAKITGVLSPEKLAYPLAGHAVFYILVISNSPRKQILQKNKLAGTKIF